MGSMQDWGTSVKMSCHLFFLYLIHPVHHPQILIETLFHGFVRTFQRQDPACESTDPRQHLIAVKYLDFILIDIPVYSCDRAAPALILQTIDNVLLRGFQSLDFHSKLIEMVPIFSLKGHSPELSPVPVKHCPKFVVFPGLI